MTVEQIIKDIEAIRHKGVRFFAEITRNNTRNKELTFFLRQHGKMQPLESGQGAARAFGNTLLEIDAVLDSVTGKVQWNYIDPEMQDKAAQIIIDARLRLSLHDRLVDIFESPNTLKITT